MLIKVYYIDFQPFSCIKPTQSDLKEYIYCKKYQWRHKNRNNVLESKMAPVSHIDCWDFGHFHIEATLYTKDHISKDICDQTEINSRLISVHNIPSKKPLCSLTCV